MRVYTNDNNDVLYYLVLIYGVYTRLFKNCVFEWKAYALFDAFALCTFCAYIYVYVYMCTYVCMCMSVRVCMSLAFSSANTNSKQTATRQFG